MLLFCLDAQHKDKLNCTNLFGPCCGSSVRLCRLLPPPKNTIGPGMQLRQPHRHFKANKLHPAAEGKAGVVCVCLCVCVWWGDTKHCHLLLLYCCQLFGLWERRGWVCVAWGLLVHLIFNPTLAPPVLQLRNLPLGIRLLGHTSTHTHTHTNKHPSLPRCL